MFPLLLASEKKRAENGRCTLDSSLVYQKRTTYKLLTRVSFILKISSIIISSNCHTLLKELILKLLKQLKPFKLNPSLFLIIFELQ